MISRIELDLGGRQEDQHEVALIIRGTECSIDDFRMALVPIVKEWRKKKNATLNQRKKGNCGCKDSH